MDTRTRLWLLLPASLRDLPADITAAVLGVALTVVSVFVPVINETPLRVLVGLVFVLFIPGYALIAALFPESGSGPTSGSETEQSDPTAEDGGIDGIERVALSFGTSIAIVPLVGLVLNFTPFGIRLVPIVASLSILTLGLLAVATRRRRALPAEDRFRVPYERWGRDVRSELFAPETRVDAALNVFLAISVILAVSSVGYAVAVPKQGESFSEFYLLTETEDGELVADDYPTEFTAGEPKSLVVGIGNHEHQQLNYTVVVLIQRARVVNNSTVVDQQRELRRFETQLADNETWHLQHQVAPELTGTNLRLVYLLYRGDPPARPSVESAYRELHLWVNVSAPATA